MNLINQSVGDVGISSSKVVVKLRLLPVIFEALTWIVYVSLGNTNKSVGILEGISRLVNNESTSVLS